MRHPPRLSLRTALTLGAVALTACALVAAGIVSAVALRAYLLQRADEQLEAAARIGVQRTSLLNRVMTGDPAAVRAELAPSDYALEVRRGTVVTRYSGADALPLGGLVDHVPAPPDGRVGAPVTVDGEFRAVAVRRGDVLAVVALPLAPARQTVSRLVGVEAMAGCAVLAVLGLAAHVLLGRRLRPLEEITATAAAIAAGRLDRRVPLARPDRPDRPDRTEVGRLTDAVNGMLTRIGTALTAEQRSQARLRQFLADASHELRTPLTSIRGYVHLLRHGMIDPQDAPDALRRVDEESARMAALVEDLLTLARQEADVPRERVDVDLVAVVRESVADSLAAQPGRPVRLRAPARCTVRGDEPGLRQVVANLLANVRVHTPPDARADVDLAVVPGPGGDRVRLEVTDAGPGMPADLVARALERFVHGGDPGRRASVGASVEGPVGGSVGGAGSGLGLAIVDEIVRAHGGTVRLESTPGEGTRVTVELPARQGRDHEDGNGRDRNDGA